MFRPRPGRLAALCGEALILLLAAGPFYLSALWLADAAFSDLLRCGLYTLGLFVLSAGLGDWLASDSFRTAGMVLMLSILFGLPGIYYICLEFAPQANAQWLSYLSPALMAWETASARMGHVAPLPIWAWLAWPMLGTAMLTAPRRRL
jgi:hypothetical protein